MNQKLAFFLVLAIALFFISCNEDSFTDTSLTGHNELTIWDGPTTVFTKIDGADISVEDNQDRITDNVWITRGNHGGQIFNIKQEMSADKEDSPIGTTWALGSLDIVEDLVFQPFRSAVGSPKEVVGKDLVLHLLEDDIYLNVRFLSWSAGKQGGFSYERSTQ